MANPRKKVQIKTAENNFSKKRKKNKKFNANLKSKESTISSFTKLQNPKILMKKLIIIMIIITKKGKVEKYQFIKIIEKYFFLIMNLIHCPLIMLYYMIKELILNIINH